MTQTRTISPELYRQILRQDLMSFIQASFLQLNPEAAFSPRPHLEVIAAKLQACRAGHIRRFILNLPPRSLKSHSVSIAFVAWLLGHEPSTSVICASYGQDLADKLSRDCRSLMMSPFYGCLFPEAVISDEKKSVGEFQMTQHGFRMSTSVGGVLTGRGADFLILDDPMKPEEALSETRRKGVQEWYDNTFASRLNNKNTGCIIVVMQRLHEDDLTGYLLERGDWEVLSFPAIAGHDQAYEIKLPFRTKTYRRQAGEVLDATRESLATLQAIRAEVGEYTFQSQYQQNPLPLEGNMVKTDWLSYYQPQELPSEFCCILQSWDTANKSGELNDFSVCTTWGEASNRRYYLLNVFRARLNYPELKRAVRRQSEVYRPTIISVEDKASGTQLIQELGSELYQIKAYEPPTGTDKQMRLFKQTAAFEDRRVFLPQSAPWLCEYVRELTSFPGSKHDDQVDSTTQALEILATRKRSIYEVL
jgi:predicted phage terminase large subunit-like protein